MDFEWVNEGPAKVPMRILLKSKELFAFAGLWDKWMAPDGNEMRSFSIITTTSAAHGLMEPMHSRMPVILSRENEGVWLESNLDTIALSAKTLTQYPSQFMDCYEVSKVVNSPSNDIEKCVERMKS